MKPLYLIDFSNFAYKFRSVYKFARVNVNGVVVDTSILYGFTKAIRENPFSDICIVLDGVPSRSKEALPSYKGQRMHDDESNHISTPKLENIQFLTQLGKVFNKNVFVVCSPLQETDEVIGSIVHRICHKTPARASFISRLNTRDIKDDRMLRYLNTPSLQLSQHSFEEYDSAVIASTDGDFLQLQRWDGVSIDTTTSGKSIASDVTSKSTAGLSHIATIPYKAIYGDMSDNIPTNNLSLSRNEVLKTLNLIKTDEQLIDFYNSCTSGRQAELPLPLKVLAKTIYHECLSGFKRNWVVAYLEYRSDPFIITFLDYNIKDTATKYKIKL